MSHGFILEREQHLTELSGTARIWRHEATGAQLVSVTNSDENKCFGVSFRTPPSDSTGVAHILEHSVLCGSEKYPVKEPFVELLKGSLQTFLNAFTFPDKTCYPVASANLADFYNLVDVYLDAVFHPRLTEDVLRQEGWHIEADEPDGPYSYKGVVFNEMKGVYSSPDSLLGEQSQQALFPDTTYGLDSGGNPEVIPQLTWAAFSAFHADYYHPSNARFFFWGDDPEEERLAILGRELAGYTRRKVDSHVPLQERLDTPRWIEESYSAGEGDDADKGHITVNWLLCEGADVEEVLCLEMLEHILLGLPGSPLRKALIDSGLGEDIAGGGLETDLRQVCFSTGLRSIELASAQDVEVLVMETLADLAEEGIAPEAVAAAVNSLEFVLRENNSGRFPRGLEAMLRSLATWLYDGDPLAPLAWEEPLARIKQRLAQGEKIFEDRIRTWFLDNQHRAVVLLTPDAGLTARKEAAEQARLDRLRDALTPDDRRELVQLAEHLREVQQREDSPEALASIPNLSPADMPRQNKTLPGEDRQAGSVPVYAHDLDTSDIVYADALLSLDGVPDRLIPLLPLFGRALTEMGTARRDYVALGLKLAAHTGGLDAGPLFSGVHGQAQPSTWLHVSGKATRDKADRLFGFMEEILLQPAFDDRERFTRMALEERARMEQSLIPMGHTVVAARLRAAFSPVGRLGEMTGGVSYLQALRDLTARLENDWSGVLADLRELHGLLARRSGLLLNLTADGALLDACLPLAERFGAALPDVAPAAAVARVRAVLPQGEVLRVPAQVNYVGKGCNLYDLGYAWHGSAHVVTRHLRMAWLWDQVRVQGGAYGVFCGLDRLTGAWTQVSYRDPDVAGTLAAYDRSTAWLKALKADTRELGNAIVGAIGDLDAYLLPDARGMASLMRRLSGDSDAARQELRDQILSTTAKDFRIFGEALEAAAGKSSIVVLGGDKAAAEAERQGWGVLSLL